MRGRTTLIEAKLRTVARCLRLGIVRQQYEAGNLTEAEALELLRGALTPGDETTVEDDSALLHATLDEIFAALGGVRDDPC